jgi:hypothetical protein
MIEIGANLKDLIMFIFGVTAMVIMIVTFIKHS